eukprot:gene23338-57598_t
MGVATAAPTHSVGRGDGEGAAEVVVRLSTPPGETRGMPSGAQFAEVASKGVMGGTAWVPRPELDRRVRTVLSLRIDGGDRLYLLDYAGHGFAGE